MVLLAFIMAELASMLYELANWNARNYDRYDPQLPKLMLGYHRLWSHRSFTAKLPLRIILAAMGTLGFQGSIRFHDFGTS